MATFEMRDSIIVTIKKGQKLFGVVQTADVELQGIFEGNGPGVDDCSVLVPNPDLSKSGNRRIYTKFASVRALVDEPAVDATPAEPTPAESPAPTPVAEIPAPAPAVTKFK